MLHFRNTSDDSLVSHSGTVGVIISPLWLNTLSTGALWVPQSSRCTCISTWSSRWQVRVQVLWICTQVQLEYKYKYQVLHLWWWPHSCEIVPTKRTTFARKIMSGMIHGVSNPLHYTTFVKFFSINSIHSPSLGEGDICGFGVVAIWFSIAGSGEVCRFSAIVDGSKKENTNSYN